MTAHNYTNTASASALDAPLNSSATSFSVTPYTGYPSVPYWILVDRDTPSAEVMEVTAVASSTLAVVRGQGGTAATSHSAGSTVEHIIPAGVPQASEAHVEATGGVHGVTGALVGTSSAQTLTSKTYQGAHTHIYSSAVPAGVPAGYLVTADTTATRDGFVANNTAADSNYRGFLLSQSGSPRVEAFYDGTVKVTPSGAATRPGIESTTSLKSATAQVTGNATVGGTLGVTGALTGSAAVQGATVASTGAMTAGTGLTVTSGNVVLSGSNARLQFPSSASGNGTATGQVRYRNGSLEAWNGSRWVGHLGSGFTGSNVSFGSFTLSSGTNTVLSSALFPDPGFEYGLRWSATAEITCPAGRRGELHLVLDDANSSTIYSYGSGVLGQTVVVNSGVAQVNGLTGSHTLYVVATATSGTGTVSVTGNGQSFAAWMEPS